MAQYGRPSAAEIVAEEQRKERDKAEALVTASAPPNSAPIGQRRLAGYKLVRTFADNSTRPHAIFRKDTLITDRRDVERLARLGAELEPVEEDGEEETDA